MVFIQSQPSGLDVLVVGPDQIDLIKGGLPLVVPAHPLLIGYCPDVIRLGETIILEQYTDTKSLAALFEACVKWPEKRVPKDAVYQRYNLG